VKGQNFTAKESTLHLPGTNWRERDENQREREREREGAVSAFGPRGDPLRKDVRIRGYKWALAAVRGQI